MMRRLVAILLFLTWPSWSFGQYVATVPATPTSGGGGTVAYVSDVVGSTYNNTAAAIATSALSVTGGNNLIGMCWWSTGIDTLATTSVSDTAGNTWTRSVTAVVNTSGTSVTWVSGTQFTGLSGDININGTAYTISVATATSITLTASAGIQTGVPLYAAVHMVGGTTVQLWESLNAIGNASDVFTCSPTGGMTGYVAARMFQFSGGTKVHDTATMGDFPSGSGPYSTFTSNAFTTSAASTGIACMLGTAAGTTAMTFTPGTGYTISSNPDTSGASSAEYRVFSSVQTAVTASITSSATTTEGAIVCDVIK